MGNFPFTASEEEERVNIVSPTQYDLVKIDKDRSFYIGQTIQEVEWDEYLKLLMEFSDVFAWSMSELTSIFGMLREHAIDLIERAWPVRQR